MNELGSLPHRPWAQRNPRHTAAPLYPTDLRHSDTEMRLKMGRRLGAAGGWGGPKAPVSKTGESDPPRLLPLLAYSSGSEPRECAEGLRARPPKGPQMLAGLARRQEGQQAGVGSLRATGVPGAAEKAEGESGTSPGGGGELGGEKEQEDREGPPRPGGGGDVLRPEGRPEKLTLWRSTWGWPGAARSSLGLWMKWQREP